MAGPDPRLTPALKTAEVHPRTLAAVLLGVPNRLAGETSPYLLQHAHNPVDWYPWGPEALARAQAEDKPICLSIGYSACHWCHVMERESFEDPRTAAVMNSAFINIKVDREERPDLDGIYMQAVQSMTGSGGWPMTVFLMPDGTPFYGGTYYPPDDRPTMPSFTRVLGAIADAWQNRRDDVVKTALQLREHLAQPTLHSSTSADTALDPGILEAAGRGLAAQHDPEFGGFGGAPKFPQPMALEFLLRYAQRSGDDAARDVAVHGLEHMAQGGIYDHLGGGFHRYSTDAEWLVPHFEKMLYDNAQLARVYLMGYQATGNASFRAVAEQVIEYVLRDMTDPSGGFYSTEDADSEGEEGAFYVWRPAELRDLLGEEDARLFGAFYDVKAPGNFEGRASILHVDYTPAEVAPRLGVAEAELRRALDRGRMVLFEARSKRIRPARDEKVLAAWNGMMLRALAEAARVLGRRDFLDAALNNAHFLLSTMRAPTGSMYRTWKPGHDARLNGYLEDQANVADGLVALYEATFDLRWLESAVMLADIILARFADPENGGFFDTSDEHETLISRPKDVFDNATPSGNTVAADVLLRLGLLTGKDQYARAAREVLTLLREPMARYPLGFARGLNALDFLLGRPKEVAVVGRHGAADTEAMLRVVFEPFLPNKVVAGSAPGNGAAIPLLEGRELHDEKATAYVCEHYVCQAPTTNPEELRALMSVS
ncbi:MAG TPA: thioredoxin domain-containing protein [Chloroflexota bacterium]|nr:thioredoxin domain-containing protein [Chloroflexota bacterium]